MWGCVTSDGVVLIDSGGTYQGAGHIHETIKSLTTTPVEIVVNTNSQDHLWLDNDYFRQQGARIIAHWRTAEDQKSRLNDQLIRLANTVGEQGLKGTQAAYADEGFDEKLDITLGEATLQLFHAGQAHTPADVFVWLPDEKAVFTGDIVYSKPLLSMRTYSHSGSWIMAFEAMAAFEPKYIVPGHGHVSTLEKAQMDTYSYLRLLRDSVAEFMEGAAILRILDRLIN